MQKRYLSEQWLNIVFSLLLVLFFSSGNTHSAPKTILVLGDSLSAEYGLARGTGWVALLEKRIKENKLDAQVINASISGDTTSGGKNRFPALLKKYQPDIVILELGANDGLRGLPLTSTEDNLRSIISASKTAKAKVLLIGMQIPPNYGPAYSNQFIAMYKTLAKQKKLAFVPFLLEGIADKPELFQADQLHSTAATHPKILDNVWPHLLPLISN